MITRSELSLTRATLRSAELGFLGFMTVTRRQMPFMHGRLPSDSAGETGLRALRFLRQPRITWLKVAQRTPRGARGLVKSLAGCFAAAGTGVETAGARRIARASGGRRYSAGRKANIALMQCLGMDEVGGVFVQKPGNPLHRYWNIEYILHLTSNLQSQRTATRRKNKKQKTTPLSMR